MDEQHPMWDRLQHQLERKGMTIEEATDDALMSWICNQEFAEARLPRTWGIEHLAEARHIIRGIAINSSQGVRLLHDNPFYGDIWITEDLSNALQGPPP